MFEIRLKLCPYWFRRKRNLAGATLWRVQLKVGDRMVERELPHAFRLQKESVRRSARSTQSASGRHMLYATFNCTPLWRNRWNSW